MKNATGSAVAFSTSEILGNTKSRILSEASPTAKVSPSRLIEMFRERCEARAILVVSGQMTLQDAVDGLQLAAVEQELVDYFGQNEVQAVMARAFGGAVR
jgi:hypothetical protein